MAVLPAAAPAASYPERPIRLIVGFVPGGAADLVARSLAQKLAERWGQQVIVDNRAGAAGVIAMQIAGKAPPDGYTLALASSSQFVFGPAMQSDTPYDAVAGYTPVAQVALVPIVLTAHPSLPARSVAELIQRAKARPGQLSYASPGAGSGPHLAGVLFARAAGIEIVHVPYKGGSEALVALLGGHVQISFGAISTALPHVKGGKLRALAVTELKRLSGQGVEIAYFPADTLAAYVKTEQAKWTRLLKEAGIQGR
jgi:tripartite-type tricarboxylate transporter receptor subunit TctC